MQQRKTLALIVLAQFCSTSVWFASNSVMNTLIAEYHFPAQGLSWMTSSVQFGFIAGTLTYAVFSLVDRFSPSRVFFISALLAAIANALFLIIPPSLIGFSASRLLVGLFLAGIYPVGMKIAADYFEAGLGKSLGYLVGALVLGTALPHLLRVFLLGFSWHWVFLGTSLLCLLGGLLVLFLVSDGPYRKNGSQLKLVNSFSVFSSIHFRRAAIGYFGHMWELYTFWTFVPLILSFHQDSAASDDSISYLSFLFIAIGSLACIATGLLSQKISKIKLARTSVLISGACSILSPWVLSLDSPALLYGLLAIWGAFVVADSPMFSTLVAESAPPKLKGTALTIVNCLGFGLTIISIQLLDALLELFPLPWLLPILSLGPLSSLLFGPKTTLIQSKK